MRRTSGVDGSRSLQPPTAGHPNIKQNLNASSSSAATSSTTRSQIRTSGGDNITFSAKPLAPPPPIPAGHKPPPGYEQLLHPREEQQDPLPGSVPEKKEEQKSPRRKSFMAKMLSRKPAENLPPEPAPAYNTKTSIAITGATPKDPRAAGANNSTGGKNISSASPPIYVLHQDTASVSPLTRKRDIGGGGGSKPKPGMVSAHLQAEVDQKSPNFATFGAGGSKSNNSRSKTGGTTATSSKDRDRLKHVTVADEASNQFVPPPGAGGAMSSKANSKSFSSSTTMVHGQMKILQHKNNSGLGAGGTASLTTGTRFGGGVGGNHASTSDESGPEGTNNQNYQRMSQFVSSDDQGGFSTDASLSPTAGRKMSAMLLSASPPSKKREVEKNSDWNKTKKPLEFTEKQELGTEMTPGGQARRDMQIGQAEDHLAQAGAAKKTAGKMSASSTGGLSTDADSRANSPSKGSGLFFSWRKNPVATAFSRMSVFAFPGGRNSISGTEKALDDEDNDDTIRKDSYKPFTGKFGHSKKSLFAFPISKAKTERRRCCSRECLCNLWPVMLIRAIFKPLYDMTSSFFGTVTGKLEQHWYAFEEKYLISFEELEETSDEDNEDDDSEVFDTGAAHLAFTTNMLKAKQLDQQQSKASLMQQKLLRGYGSSSKRLSTNSKSKSKPRRSTSSGSLSSSHDERRRSASRRRGSSADSAGDRRGSSSRRGGGANSSGGEASKSGGNKYRMKDDLHGGILLRQGSKGSVASSTRRTSSKESFQGGSRNNKPMSSSKSFYADLYALVPERKKSGWLSRRAEAARQRRKAKLKEQGHRKPEDVAMELILKYKSIDLTPDEEKNKTPLPPDAVKFNLVMTFFIVLNTIFIWLQTDINVKQCDDAGTCCPRGEQCPGRGEVTSIQPVAALDGDWYWYTFDVVFLLIFLGELYYRYSYHGKNLFKDPFTLFDGFVVFLGCIDTFILAPFAPESGGALRMFTVFRTLRLVKLGRLLSLFPVFNHLMKIAHAYVASLPAVGTVLCLFLMLIYFFGILFTVIVGKKREIYAPYRKLSGWDWRDYFGSSGTTMQTLIVLATKGGDWASTVVRPVTDNQPALIVLWIFFIMVCWYGLLNIVVSVVVAETLKLGKARHAQKEIQQGIIRIERMEELKVALTAGDTNHDNMISLPEWNFLLNEDNGAMRARLEDVGFDLNMTRELFDILDVEEKGSVRFEDFMGAALRINSVDDAEAKDMYATNLTMHTLNEKLATFEKTMAQGLDTVNMLLFYVESKLYRGYSDMVDRSRMEFEKRSQQEGAACVMPKPLPPSADDRSDGAAVPRFPNVVPTFRSEPLYEEDLDNL
ncbi:unnamed protein product [Amoebophrya sp. A120]|nr:unnamed protein product [Amoebophrya sp. A120]|eukprot:GSA120T00000962001.1